MECHCPWALPYAGPPPSKSSCSAVGYLILRPWQAMTTLLTTRGSCCSGLWKILSETSASRRHSRPQFFPAWSYSWRPSPKSPYCGWSRASLAKAWGGRRRPRGWKTSPLVHQSQDIHCQGSRCYHPLFCASNWCAWKSEHMKLTRLPPCPPTGTCSLHPGPRVQWSGIPCSCRRGCLPLVSEI